MERKIVRHAVGAAGHEAALDAEFHVGQRVVTIDGVAGRIQFVTGSFSPGVAEYQVVLDNGMGGGTYTASQLRAVPDSYRAPSGPHNYLPAGVTAGYVTEDQARQRWLDSPEARAGMSADEVLRAQAGEIHLASDDYPEMGQILHDRPDPAGLIRTIGKRSEHEDREPRAGVPLRALRPTAGLTRTADDYAKDYDARDGDDNGGEAGTGLYWEAPGNQQWRDENLPDAPEPVIEDAEEPPGFGQEEFEDSFGKVSTTINGQEIDGHGDAPQHGTTPRATEPNSYDSQSTEGQGDPDEDKPASAMDDDTGDGATAGMFPSGVYAGDGFGEMSFGAAFGQDQRNWDDWNDYAADKPADPHDEHDSDDEDELRYPEEHIKTEGRVPWTGQERTELHSWDNETAASAGDFVPSGNFTGRHPLQPHEQLDEPAQEVIERSLQAQGAVHPDVFCAVRHDGPCRYPEPMKVHGESLRHPRPRGFSSEVHPVDDDTRELAMRTVGLTPTHVLKGYQNGQHVGSLHYQQSDDGKAAYVTNLESHKSEGHGVGSAMMDDLYSHAHQHGMWVNHGQRTPEGMSWWNSYREPHPEHNVHNAMPNQGTQGGKSWQHYWDPREVAADMHFHSESDPAGKHEPPKFNPHLYDETADYGRHWKGSTRQLPKEQDPFEGEAMRDAMRDMHAAGHGADEYHGWGDLAREHAHTAAASPDHHYARHLMDAHGYSAADVERVRAHGLHDMHGVLHESGLADHTHSDLSGELAAGSRAHHDSQAADQFGRPLSHPMMRAQTRPEKGGAVRESDYDQLSTTHVQAPEDAITDPAKLHAYYSSRAEAGVRVRTNGPNDFTFHHVPDDSEDPSNSLDDGDPDEDSPLDREQDENGLENGEPRDEDTGETGAEAPAGGLPGKDEATPGDGQEPQVDGAGGEELPGNLPAGVQPPSSPSKRPPNVPQHPSVPPETWPLATAPVQERPLPLSQGGKPSPSTKRSNPVKLELPGAGDGAEVDGEKPGGDDKPPPKEAALAAFTAAAGSEAFRFEFTASWRDVVAKAKRLRKGGRVRITHVSAGMVIGEVGGDHDVYESGIQRPPGKPQTIQHWACGCPWASFRQDSSYPGRLNGRPCSHVYALQLEASSRYSSSHSGDVYQDLSADQLGVPHNVVVKSMPPWGAGGWSQTWLAPAASLARTAEMFCPACGDDRDDSGRCYGCGKLSTDPRQEHWAGKHDRPEHPDWAAAPEDDTDWEYYETEDPADNPWGQGRHRKPAHEAARVLVAAGEDPADVELLARVAGIDLTGAANDPWGDNNYAEQPPAKPYGATTPRDPSQNPANTGPLNSPDPENWAEIPDTGMSQPMVTTSSLPGLDTPGQPVPEAGGAVPYPYRANSAGPATPADPADPNGLSVDASASSDGAEYERHLIEQHGVHPDYASRYDHEKHLIDHDDVNQMAHHGEPLPGGYQPHPYHQTGWEHRQELGSWPDAGESHSFTGAEHRELPDETPGAGEHHSRECVCPTCEYDRYHAKHAVLVAVQAGMAELQANGEADRQRAGIDGTMADAQDVPHAFSGNTPYCRTCGMAAEHSAHHRDGAEGELHTTPEPALPETTADLATPDSSQYALDPGATGGGPGMSGGDESLSPDDTSIQTVGAGEDGLNDESFSVSPQENAAEAYADDPVSQFQATAAARQYAGGGGAPGGDGDLATAAKEFLAKTADVLPDHEAAALISEGQGRRARNLDLLQLEGTHYEGIDDEMGKRGLSLDDYDDDLVVT